MFKDIRVKCVFSLYKYINISYECAVYTS